MLVLKHELRRLIFERYSALGSVKQLRAELNARQIESKTRITANGRRSGGKPFARGALYQMLQNRLYRGEVAHRGNVDGFGCVRPRVHESCHSNGRNVHALVLQAFEQTVREGADARLPRTRGAELGLPAHPRTADQVGAII